MSITEIELKNDFDLMINEVSNDNSLRSTIKKITKISRRYI